MIQLLLGNIGVAGGGINALRGEPNVQGSTDHAILWHILPGYHPVPNTNWPTLADYNKANTPVTKDPKSANWWGNRPKYVASLLKAWFGDAATAENEFGYAWLPKVDPGVDYASLYQFDRMYKGAIKGGFIYGHNPAQSMINTNQIKGHFSIQAIDELKTDSGHILAFERYEASGTLTDGGDNPLSTKGYVVRIDPGQANEQAYVLTQDAILTESDDGMRAADTLLMRFSIPILMVIAVLKCTDSMTSATIS